MAPNRNRALLVVLGALGLAVSVLNIVHFHSVHGSDGERVNFLGDQQNWRQDKNFAPARPQKGQGGGVGGTAASSSAASAGGGKKADDKSKKAPVTKKDAPPPPPQDAPAGQQRELHHPLGGLSCADHGGPSDEVAEEMIFWQDIPNDSAYKSPFIHTDSAEEKYLSFEPDHGGWNNIRMAMETTLVIAHATGRTLVLPPEKPMYLLNKDAGTHKTSFTFNDFFHLDSIAVEHQGFNVITTEEFLKRRAMAGKLADQKTGRTMLPPQNRTNWDGENLQPLFNYLRTVGNVPIMDPWECVFAVPSSSDPNDVQVLNWTLHGIKSGKNGRKPPTVEEFRGSPIPVDASLEDRMREMVIDRKDLCIYDETLQAAPLVHFKVDKESRLLTHFYAFVFFQDWRQDLWSKRFVRDHVRYIDDIVCAAARIVEKVRERARARDPANNAEGIYDSMHVRRGDFQYKPTRLEADVLYNKSREELTEGSTMYIATDERDKTFFEPLKRHYEVFFLDDFMDVIKGVNTNYYGMLDQLVASKGRVFFGTWWSTLSGYVNRMRGYYITKHKLPGYKDGTMQSYYFFPDERKPQMIAYEPVRQPIYMREFPTSWRDLEKGLEDFHRETNKNAR